VRKIGFDCYNQFGCERGGAHMGAAENDSLGIGAQTQFGALTCPKKLIRFRAAEGAGEHREMMNRSLVNRAVLARRGSRLIA
jgi:hypothetical protein